MAPALPWIIGAGIGMEALGQYGAGQAASQQAKAQQAMAEYNAKVQESEAKAAERQALFQQSRQAEAADRLAASQRANIAASGLPTTEGTPLLVQSKQAAQSELENLMIGYEGQQAAQRARSQAGLDTMQASYYGQQAKSASTAGLMGAGSTLLSGFGGLGWKMYDTGWTLPKSGSTNTGINPNVDWMRGL